MLIFGALYQLIPVIYETSLFSEKLATVTFWIFLISIILLSYSFWIGSFTELLMYASILMFFSLSLFIVNLHLTYKKAPKKNLQSKFINTGIYWLAITEILGIIIAFNFKYDFLSKTHLHYLKIHAHFGMIGWFLLLIIGASSVLIPMFLISHNLNIKKLKSAYVFINIGLIAVSIDWLFIHSVYFIYLYWLIISIGISYFLSYVLDSYKKRLRKKLDVGLKYTMIAIFMLVLPIILAIYLIMQGNSTAFSLRMSIFYGLSIFFGVISMLIFGQTYKTLPFIVWLEKYQKYVGKYKTPFPRELYSEKLANFQFYLYLFAISLIAIGVIIKQFTIVLIGNSTLIIVSLLNFFNIMKMVFHKKQLKNL